MNDMRMWIPFVLGRWTAAAHLRAGMWLQTLVVAFTLAASQGYAESVQPLRVAINHGNAVLARIDAAVQQDEALRKARSQKAQQQPAQESRDDSDEPELPAVRLAQRAAPMQQMLQRSIAEESDIVWGV